MALKQTLQTSLSKEYKELDDTQLSHALLLTYEKIVLPLALAATEAMGIGYAGSKGKQSYGIIGQYEREIALMLKEAKSRAEQRGVKIPPSTRAKGLTCELEKSDTVRDWEERFIALGPLFSDSGEKDEWRHFSAWRNNEDYVVGFLREGSPYGTEICKFRAIYDDDRSMISGVGDGRIIDQVKQNIPSEQKRKAEISKIKGMNVR